ncbi:MAG: sigma-70 family RNA polymerase sigma factor [Planctomycetes bacterium]|nr:sigma-70 family RNA polymerase sigma factor [Planctomycetota bacterium]
MSEGSETTDVELLRRIAAEQDRDAFRVLYARHKNAAYNLALHVAGEEPVAEEAVQDAMVRAWKYAKGYDEKKGTVRTWLLRIVARQSMERIMAERKRRREHAEDEEILQNRAGASAAEGDAERGELLGALRNVFRRLPAADRRMVALYYGGGLSQEEIAETMAMPKRTVSYRLQKAIEQLREDLTRAGFAAAAPLLAGEGLSEALCGGALAPAALDLRVFEGVDKAQVLLAGAEVSRRVAAFSWKAFTPWLAVLAVALAGSGYWYARQAEPRTASEGAAPLSNGTPAPAAGLAYAGKVWTFETGPAPDLAPDKGVWTWRKDKEPWGGVMELVQQDEVSFTLPLRAPGRPFLLRTEYTPIVKNEKVWDIASIAHYGRGRADLPEDFDACCISYFEATLPPPNWHVVDCYFWDRYSATYVDGKLSAVYTLAKPYPRDDLFVAFGGSMKVRKIELRMLRDGELPGYLDDMEALTARLCEWKALPNRPDILFGQPLPQP